MSRASFIKDIVFKVILFFLLVYYFVVFIDYLGYTVSSPNVITFYAICVGFYYISLISFIVYLNKYVSEKLMAIPLVVLLVVLIYEVIIYASYNGNGGIFSQKEILRYIIILSFALITNVFTIFNIVKKCKYNVVNYVFLIIAVIALFTLTIDYVNGVHFMFHLLLVIAYLINILYLSLSSRGNKEYFSSKKAYDRIISAKKLYDDNIITNEEYEKIRTKYVKHL